MNNTSCFLTQLNAVLFGCYAATVSAAPNPASKDYVNSTVIGRAAQGGVVFFTYLSGGVVHGLVAAQEDEPGGNIYTQESAMYQCAHKTTNGYSDWFLPNKAQATALYNNRFSINPNHFNGGFNDVGNSSYYWSSSTKSNDIDYGWVQHFGSGIQTDYPAMINEFSARCVRTF